MSLAASQLIASGLPAHADTKDEVAHFVDAFLVAAGPVLTNMGVSGIVGFCVARAIKFVSGILAVLIGVGYIVYKVSGMSDNGPLSMSNIQDRVTRTLDTDRDGKYDVSDLRHQLNQGIGWLCEGVPNVAGFLAGMAFGLK